MSRASEAKVERLSQSFAVPPIVRGGTLRFIRALT